MQNTVDLWSFINISYKSKSIKAQYHVDLWIFQNMKIKVQKVTGTVRKMLWICGFLIYTHLIVLLV